MFEMCGCVCFIKCVFVYVWVFIICGCVHVWAFEFVGVCMFGFCNV